MVHSHLHLHQAIILLVSLPVIIGCERLSHHQETAQVIQAEATPNIAEINPIEGERKLLVLLVNFDNFQETARSIAEAEAVFATMNDFVQEVSYGRVQLRSEVHGWFTLPISVPEYTLPDAPDRQKCRTGEGPSTTDVARESQVAATSAGIDLTAFDHIVYVYPNTSCLHSGYAHGHEVWLKAGFLRLDVAGHELMHNFGALHSGSISCGNKVLATDITDCPQFSVYGDYFDMMGTSKVAHLNAQKKRRLGWLEESRGELQTVTKDGVYEIGVLETPHGALPKALRIFRSADPVTGDLNFYYLEYRQPIGFDSFLQDYRDITDGVLVHVGNDTTPAAGALGAGPMASSILLDMTPNSVEVGYPDHLDAALRVGQQYTDPDPAVGGLTFHVLSANSSRVTVELTNVTKAPTSSGGGGEDVEAPRIEGLSVRSTTGVTLDPLGLTKGDTVALVAEVVDNQEVASVFFEVFDGSNVIHTCTVARAPFSCWWKVPKGKVRTLIIKVVATDGAGNLSDVATLNVRNAGSKRLRR